MMNHLIFIGIKEIIPKNKIEIKIYSNVNVMATKTIFKEPKIKWRIMIAIVIVE